MTHPFRKFFCLALICFCSFPGGAQQIIARFSRSGDDPLEKKLSEQFVATTYELQKVPTLKLPNRRHSSLLFVNEFIPFKEGYIINSLTTSPSAGSTEIKYNFFFLNLASNSISAIEINGIDTIHSIINNDGIVYVSGKKGDQLKVIQYTGQGIKELAFGGDLVSEIQQPRNWLKLGVYNNQLIALSKNGVLQYSNGNWLKLLDNSIDDYYLQLGYKRSKAIIPTENIRIYKDKLYFLQEIVQLRSADLFTIDLKKQQSMSEFFTRHHLTDNTKKEIDCYLLSNDGKLYVVVNRLMENQIVLCESGDTVSTIILNGRLKDKANDDTPINTSSITEQDGRQIMIGTTGVFELKDRVIKPMLLLDNMVQQIKDEGFTFNEQFKPRSIAVLGPSKYLIGGLFGGLYILDLNEKKIKCLDDLKEQPKPISLF